MFCYQKFWCILSDFDIRLEQSENKIQLIAKNQFDFATVDHSNTSFFSRLILISWFELKANWSVLVDIGLNPVEC